jgi:GAF domain-containing protein
MEEDEWNGLLSSIEYIVGDDEKYKLQRICDLLRSRVKHYDWVGFYLVDSEEERMLILGPYSGEPTQHLKIPFGNGICGQAADTGRLFLIQDVSREENYLSCSTEVRSEIVLPIYRDGDIIGELDIDSHSLSPFKEEDNIFLEKVCLMVHQLL